MNVKNKERDRVKTVCTPQELGDAIASLDLASIPPEHRRAAIAERVVEVMIATTDSPDERRKETFQKAITAYGQLHRARQRNKIII